MSSAVPVRDGGEHDGTCPLGVAFRVRRAQHGSPRHPEHHPAVDPEVGTNPLDVGDVVIHVDACPVHPLLTGVRRALSRRALVEHHRPVAAEVEVTAGARRAAGAGSSVQVDDRRSAAVAELLDVQHVTVADVQAIDGERLGE